MTLLNRLSGTLFICCFALSLAHAAEKTEANNHAHAKSDATATYYLVRHAEKEPDGSKDPELTEQGQLRAKYLAQQLSLANITKIYSSDTKRTQATAKPLADLLGLKVESYNPRELEEFAENLRKESGNLLIVGHSNTTPPLASLLSGEEVDAMNESEYENLYQVVVIEGEGKLSRFRIFPMKQ